MPLSPRRPDPSADRPLADHDADLRDGRGRGAPACVARQRRAIARFDRMLARQCRKLEDAALARPTLVVAPHPDDETLGCGGTIARIRAAGAPVIAVACTDGSRSHPRLMPPAELRERRAAEFLAACQRLGVEPPCVHLLGHADGSLAAHVDEAARTLASLIAEHRIERILVPFRGESVADHLAAREAGLRAREIGAQRTEVLEYPIWFWNVWPFVQPEVHGVRSRWRAMVRARRARRLARDLDIAVELGRHLQSKRDALVCHRSQVTRLVDDPRWMTLADVAGGAWLERCLGPAEYFARA